MSYSLLSEPIKRFIREKKWDNFRPIQSAAITKIITTKENYILSSRTASGKTEAALLPIISMMDSNADGVQVLYISPLIALINDQFIRIEDLCKFLDVKITKWHGDSNRSLKDKLLKNPSGILLITPESIEALFANKSKEISGLFSNLKFIVIDEIHSFLGTERGIQLKSLIFRIKEKVKTPIRCIGLSATLGDFEEAKSFFGDYNSTKVLRDSTGKDFSISLKYFSSENDELSKELIFDLYQQTKNNKVLIFPNSRGAVEEVAVKLKGVSQENGGHQNYFSHHSSINKEFREHIEKFAKNNERANFSISCTSTLEMGVDIGSVDLVAQIDSTNSVSSLAQRLGRSGRREGKTSNLIIYGTKPWKLLQSLACVELLKEGFSEPVKELQYPIDVLFHQILSILKETLGISKNNLISKVNKNPAFSKISETDVISLIEYMIKEDLIEDIRTELILGNKAEKLVDSLSFYSVFKIENNFSIMHRNREIGQIPVSRQIRVNDNIYFAARIWTIIDVDISKLKIFVEPANDGKKPKFFGTGGNLHKKIRHKMLEILLDDKQIEDCNQEGVIEIENLREIFSGLKISDHEFERPVIETSDSIKIFTFTGSKINQTLNYLLKSMFEDFIYNEEMSYFEIPEKIENLGTLLGNMEEMINGFEINFESVFSENEKKFSFSKWGEFLNTKFKQKMILNSFFDIPDTKNFIENLRLISF